MQNSSEQANFSNPEFLIPAIYKKSLELLKHVDINLPEDAETKEIETSLQTCLRRLCIHTLFLEEFVISITGCQGEGKSTLANELFENRLAEFIPQNLERGEKIPVLIRSEGGSVVAKVKQFRKKEGEWDIEEVSISPKDFMARCKKPDMDDIILILEVPAPRWHGFNPNISFLLLPGLEDPETMNDEDKLWQSFTEETLIASSGAIMLVNPARYGQKEIQNAKKLVLEEFRAASPVFVISKADQNEKLAEEIKAQIIKDHDLDENHHDQVLIKGSYQKDNPDYQRWIPLLIAAIAKYGPTRQAFRLNQIRRLDKVVKDTKIVISGCRRSLKGLNLAEDHNERKLRMEMELFDAGVKDLRKEFKDQVTRALRMRHGSAIERFKTQSDHKGFFEKLFDWFTGESKSLRKFEREMEDHWKGDYSMADERILILGTVAKRVLYQHAVIQIPTLDQPPRQLLLADSANSFDPVDPDESTTDKWKICLTEETRRDLVYVMNPKSLGEASNDFDKTLKIMPCMVLEMGRFLALVPEFQKALESHDLSSLKESLAQTQGHFDLLRTFQGKMLSGIAVMCGIDVAVAGEVNSIPALVTAMAPTAPAWVASAATGAGLLVAGSFAVSALMQQLVIQDNDRYLWGKRMANAMRDSCYVQYLDEFDNTMDYFRKCVDSRLSDRYKLGKKVGEIHNFKVCLAQLEEDLKELSKAIHENTNPKILAARST
jgi:putative protein kinase ArgK-like GTPase of G3E family